MVRQILAWAAIAALAACSSPEDVAEDVGLAAPAMAQEPAEAAAVQPGAIAIENDTMTFKYAWPAEASAIAPLAALMAERAERDRANFERDAAAALEVSERSRARSFGKDSRSVESLT